MQSLYATQSAPGDDDTAARLPRNTHNNHGSHSDCDATAIIATTARGSTTTTMAATTRQTTTTFGTSITTAAPQRPLPSRQPQQMQPQRQHRNNLNCGPCTLNSHTKCNHNYRKRNKCVKLVAAATTTTAVTTATTTTATCQVQPPQLQHHNSRGKLGDHNKCNYRSSLEPRKCDHNRHDDHSDHNKHNGTAA